MTSPCGKCNTCPCGTSGSAPPPQQPSHRPPPTYCTPPPQPQQPQQPQQQPESCPYTSQVQAGCQQQQQPQQQQQHQPQQQNQGHLPHSCAGHPVQSNQPRQVHRECTCTQNRVRNAPQTVPVDNVTCSRGPAVQPVMEARCNCHELQAAAAKNVECTCTPPVVTAEQACPQQCPSTNTNVYCGQSPRRGPVPYQRPVKQPGPCGHCRAQNHNQNKKKKCVIQ